MLMFLLALLPIAVILILMLLLRWGAARAGAAGYLVALLISIVFFGSGLRLLAFAHSKAFFLTIDVLLIIWGAFLLYRVADEAGAIKTIGEALPGLTADPGMQALIIGFAFATFLQGVGGFGVPVAVIAPILVGLGFAPMAAVVIPSIGHAWSVTFGSLGSSFQALMSATGLSADVLGPPSAFMLGFAAIPVAWMVAHASGGWHSVRRLFWPALVMAVLMAGVQYFAVLGGFWNIGGFLGGTAGLMIAYPLARRYPGSTNQKLQISRKTLLIALSAYLLMILITLVVQVVPAIKSFLSGVVFQVNFPQTETALGYITSPEKSRAIPIFRHAGTLLAYASISAYFIYHSSGLYRSGAVARILSGTVQKVMSSSVGIASMVTMASIMQISGMTDTLARGIADTVGQVFPFFAPWIGALGAFMTGSNTNSNVLFGALQMRTADLLGISAAVILAAQTAGAALGSAIAPTKVVVGASTAGMEGQEGEVMRKLISYIFLLILFMSFISFVAIWYLENTA
jgi:lactate permease